MGNGIRRLPLILWAISIGLGTHGFHSYRGADWNEIGTLSDSLYRAEQLLALEFASAGRVHVARGDDEINVEVAGLLARELAGRPPGTLRVHLSNTPADVGSGQRPRDRPRTGGRRPAAARDLRAQDRGGARHAAAGATGARGPRICAARTGGRRRREDARRVHDLMLRFEQSDLATRLRDLSMVCAVLDLQEAEVGAPRPAIDRWRRAARPACRLHPRLIPPHRSGARSTRASSAG